MDVKDNESLDGLFYPPALRRRMDRQRTLRRWRQLFSQATDPSWLWENGHPIPALLWVGLAVAIWVTVFAVLWCITP